ncbi:hypothetical protein CTI12_AA307440 [Artemisia annua]|uniref:GRF-type domain-containing protein n=1 Tax=Artemisia annua TaxID=35608 RepID=A0A2U1N4E0_ARTAN|nr:hypothetical protein CTI12_AA307440 [Artemisia annua]
MANLCGCGEIAKCRTSWTQFNPGRRFLGCPNFMDPTRNCNYFRWVDGPLPNRWYQGTMYQLHVNLVNAQDQVVQANNQHSRTAFYNRVLIVLILGMFLVNFI